MAKNETKELQKQEASYSQRFTQAVVKEFGAQVGGTMELTEYQERLAQHLFIAIDAALKSHETKRAKENKDGLPVVWANIDMDKLALDSMHRVELGLDALIPNHVHVIPYMNTRKKKYDLDLRIGYVGKDYYRRTVALDEPVDIIYELVYEKDSFKPVKKSMTNEIESYEFDIPEPFSRGKVIGGFGYIVYSDSRKNKLVIVTKADFDKSRKHAKSKTFWEGHEREMQYKTLVHRTTEKLNIDPEKVNAAFMRVEIDEEMENAEREAEENANREIITEDGEIVDAEFSETEKKDPAPATKPPTSIEPELDEKQNPPAGEVDAQEAFAKEIEARETILGTDGVQDILGNMPLDTEVDQAAALKKLDTFIDQQMDQGEEGPDF